MIIVKYGDTQLPMPVGTTAADAKEALARFYPEVRNAQAHVDDAGNVEFKVVSGTKGSTIIVKYGDTQLPMPGDTTAADAKEALARFYPEVRNAQAIVADNGDIEFKVVSGTKGN